MDKKYLKSLFFGVMLLAVISFVQAQAQDNNTKIIEEYTPKLQIESVIQKSREYAISQGQKLSNYFIESIKYDADRKEWTILFMGKLPAPGNEFGVTIKDRTGKMQLFLGE